MTRRWSLPRRRAEVCPERAAFLHRSHLTPALSAPGAEREKRVGDQLATAWRSACSCAMLKPGAKPGFFASGGRIA